MTKPLALTTTLLILALTSCTSRSSVDTSGSGSSGQNLSSGGDSVVNTSATPEASPTASPQASATSSPAETGENPTGTVNACAPVSGYIDLDSCKKATGAQCAPSLKSIRDQSVLCYFAINGSEACANNPSKWAASSWGNWCFYAHNIVNSSDYHRYRTVNCSKSNAACACAGEAPAEMETCTLCSATKGSTGTDSASAKVAQTSCKSSCPAEVNAESAPQCGAVSEPTSNSCSFASLIESCENCVLHSEVKDRELNQTLYKILLEKNKTIRMDINRCGTTVARESAPAKAFQLIFGAQKYQICKDGDRVSGVFSFDISRNGKSKAYFAATHIYNTRGECKSMQEIVEHFYSVEEKSCRAIPVRDVIIKNAVIKNGVIKK